jgi:hypothetical protein
MDTDNINLIAVLKQTTNGDKKYRNNKNRTTPESLLSLGYKYDDKLSISNTLLFYKEDVKKMILIFDGLDGKLSDNFRENYIMYFGNFVDYLIQTDIQVNNLMEKIKEIYKDYKKICIGYSLGGFYLSKYIDNNFLNGYIYNGVFVKKCDNVINYVNNIDFLTLSSCIYGFDNISLIKNTQLLNFLLNNNFNLRNYKSHLLTYTHLLDSVKEDEIPYIIF